MTTTQRVGRPATLGSQVDSARRTEAYGPCLRSRAGSAARTVSTRCRTCRHQPYEGAVAASFPVAPGVAVTRWFMKS